MEQRKVLTVSQVTKDIKLVLDEVLGRVWVEGEISNFKRYPSGHIYFSLKDEEAQIRCVSFYNLNRYFRCELKDGVKIIAFGRISVYGKSGQYQLYVERVELKGLGQLQLAFEQLKQRLSREGLFSPEHKRPLPVLPLHIGVATSSAGAAIRDILSVLKRRAPFVSVLIRPCQVQGEGAAQDIARAIGELNEYGRGRLDALIVGRGGGSIEDLWAFNEEVVARAIYGSDIPVISAVGHEIDWTIADFVSDLRAPTPSAAAEVVIKKKDEIAAAIDNSLSFIRNYLRDKAQDYGQRLDERRDKLRSEIGHILEIAGHRHDNLAHKITLLNPRDMVARNIKQTEDLNKRLLVNIEHILSARRDLIKAYSQRLVALNPLNVLARGFSLSARLDTDRVIRSSRELAIGDMVKTKLSEGEFIGKVEKVFS
ncbi:MAG: exodeoxyribonuclease VII large subunit [Candidatus Omnitrophota bacterium]